MKVRSEFRNGKGQKYMYGLCKCLVSRDNESEK